MHVTTEENQLAVAQPGYSLQKSTLKAAGELGFSTRLD